MTARRGLRHAAFFEALAALDSTSLSWRETTAGLVTLRLADRWVELRADGRVPPVEAVRAVRRAVGRVDRDSPLRGPLDALSCAVSGSLYSYGPTPAECLLAYGKALHVTAQWALAIDVYLTYIATATGAGTVDGRAEACLRIGACRRLMGRLSEASDAYRAAAALARALGDGRRALVARVGEAGVALQRGNLPAAEATLEAVRTEALAAGYDNVVAMATHNLGDVLYHRATADPDGAINVVALERAAALFFEAFARYTEPARRDRALVDLATTLAARGLRAAARDAFLALHHTTTDAEVRWVATMNLVDVASWDRDSQTFEHYRSALAAAPLPPLHAARFHMIVGDGERRLGRTAEAHAAYVQAIAIAETHEINEVLVLAEAADAALARSEPLAAAMSAEPPNALAHVVEQLGAMRGRALAGVCR